MTGARFFIMTFTHSVAYQIGDIVYSRVESDARGVVVGIIFRQTGVMYLVAWNTSGEERHYDCELQREKAIDA